MTEPATTTTSTTPAEQVAANRRLVTAAIATQAAVLAATLWARLDPADVLGSWDAALGPTAQRIVAAGQAAAAAGAQDYVSAALVAQEVSDAQLATVAPMAMVGAASDGRSLETLLRRPAVSTVDAAGQGVAGDLALRKGRAQLERMVRSEVTDAGRVASSVAIVAAEHAVGFVRMLTSPSCARCIILAGRVYRYDAGFDRHPHCDCVGIPVAEDVPGDLTTDPMVFFHTLSTTEQNKIFTSAGASAVRDGADLARVVNARLDMASMTVAGRQVQITRQGTKRIRGAARGRRVPVRLTPQSIYEAARGNRTEALRLLRIHGYVL